VRRPHSSLRNTGQELVQKFPSVLVPISTITFTPPPMVECTARSGAMPARRTRDTFRPAAFDFDHSSSRARDPALDSDRCHDGKPQKSLPFCCNRASRRAHRWCATARRAVARSESEAARPSRRACQKLASSVLSIPLARIWIVILQIVTLGDVADHTKPDKSARNSE